MNMRFSDNQNNISTNILVALLDVLPYSIVICDKNGAILFYNKRFIYTLPFEWETAHEEQGLMGKQLNNIVVNDLSSQLKQINDLESGEMLNNCTIKGLEYNSSVYFLNDKDQFVLVMRDCCNEESIKEELKEQLESIICENQNMVKSIGTILGESSAKRIKLLNSFIKALR